MKISRPSASATDSEAFPAQEPVTGGFGRCQGAGCAGVRFQRSDDFLPDIREGRNRALAVGIDAQDCGGAAFEIDHVRVIYRLEFERGVQEIRILGHAGAVRQVDRPPILVDRSQLQLEAK